MPELPELPEVHHLHHHAHGDPFGRFIAIATVLATATATFVAVLQANAVRTNQHASALAQTFAVESLGNRSATEGAARVQVERFELAEQQRARAGLARQQLLFAPRDQVAELRQTAERWNAIAEETDKQSLKIAKSDHVEPLEREGEFGPAHDPIFPLRYLALSREHAYELEAERQAENRIAVSAEEQFAAYAVSFTLLAIATFLFGYSLTPHGRPRRRLFAGSAITFVAIAVTNAALTALAGGAHPSKEAAKYYAEGQVAADSNDARAAVEHFSKAIKLDPEFADAYVGRADAAFLAGSPLALSGGSNVTSPETLVRVIADERRARELGIRDPLFHGKLGSDLLSLGLQRRDDKALEESVDLLREAMRSSENDPSAAYDLGAALVALGRYDEAGRAFDIAVERTVFVERDGKKEKRNDPLSEEEFLAVGLEDLQNVAEQGEGSIAERIAGIKQRLVSAVAAEQAGGEGQAKETPTTGEEPAEKPSERLRGVRLELSPGATRFTIPAQPGFSPTKDRLSVQWYYQDPRKLGWTVLTEVSSVSEPPLPPGASPTYNERGPYLGLTSPAACLPSGEYRLELYVNGQAATVVSKGFDNPLIAADLRGLGAGLCRPRDWEESKRREPGLVEGFVDRAGDAGTYVFSLTPSLVGTGEQPSRARMGVVLDRVLSRFAGLLPARPGSPAPSPVRIASLPDALVRSYRVGGGRLLAGIGQARNGQLLVSVVFGPAELFGSGDAQRIFGSLTDRT